MPSNPTNTVVGLNIRQLRTQLNITQESLAAYLSTSREQVAYYETGKRAISSSHLSKLSDLFCVNEYDFFEEDPDKKKLNIAFAFRADMLQQIDLESIAKFKKIVKNYINMKTALCNE